MDLWAILLDTLNANSRQLSDHRKFLVLRLGMHDFVCEVDGSVIAGRIPVQHFVHDTTTTRNRGQPSFERCGIMFDYRIFSF
jgi:hypothetical protein